VATKSKDGKVKTVVPAKNAPPAWQSEEAYELINKQLKTLFKEHGDSDEFKAVVDLLLAARSLVGYRYVCKEILAKKAPKVSAKAAVASEDED
jgi:hypothetical protein